MALRHYIVYENPDDYPLQYVLRRWTITQAGSFPDPNPICVNRDVMVVRRHIPSGAVDKGPSKTDKADSPRIIEVWVYEDLTFNR